MKAFNTQQKISAGKYCYNLSLGLILGILGGLMTGQINLWIAALYGFMAVELYVIAYMLEYEADKKED